MRDLNFTHLRLLAIFATVVEVGSFAAAARRLKTSRSRISEQVAGLELDLGTRLLQRSTRHLEVTDEGRQVYAQARQLPAILEDVEVLITPTRPRGRVGITMPHDIAHKFFLPVLKPFQAAYPEIQLDMILDDARLNLIEGQIDLAIRVGIPKEESFIARVMHEEAVQIFASPEYIQTIGPLETLQDLEKCHWILLSQMSQTQILHLRQGETTIEIKPEKFYRCDSPLMVQQMIRQGLGIGCILPNIIKKEIQTGQFVRVMPSLTSEAIIFALIYPSRRQLPLRTRTVISYLLATKMFG